MVKIARSKTFFINWSKRMKLKDTQILQADFIPTYPSQISMGKGR
jgi:hypothetical protein